MAWRIPMMSLDPSEGEDVDSGSMVDDENAAGTGVDIGNVSDDALFLFKANATEYNSHTYEVYSTKAIQGLNSWQTLEKIMLCLFKTKSIREGKHYCS
eukprot:4299994-Ditylum_brightwellii.AAC.1